MVETKFRDNAPMRRHLITKGEIPIFAGGGKSTIKERLIFTVLVIALIVFIIIFFLR